MDDRVKLDPRPRRQDLTSRECCSIIGGVIGGMVDAWGIPTTRDLVRVFVKVLKGSGWAASKADLEVLEARHGSKEMASILGATVSVLHENGSQKAALDGLIWWAERSDAEWEQIVSPKAGAPA